MVMIVYKGYTCWFEENDPDLREKIRDWKTSIDEA